MSTDQDTGPDTDQDWVCRQLARYTYKPGWGLTFSEHAGWIYLDIRYLAPDSRGSGQTVKIGRTQVVPAHVTVHRDPDRFQRWLHMLTRDMELHELDEWFRCDGELVNDPHRT